MKRNVGLGLVAVFLLGIGLVLVGSRKPRDGEGLRFECKEQLMFLQRLNSNYEDIKGGVDPAHGMEEASRRLLAAFFQSGEGWTSQSWAKTWRQREDFVDPWGRPYNRKFHKRGVVFWSSGENGVNENGLGDDMGYVPW